MAQFASFVDPFIILLAIPPGISGVILFLLLTGTTINIMSLMGVLMMTGIVVSDSILIVEFTGQLREQGRDLEDAIITACKVSSTAHSHDNPSHDSWTDSYGTRT